MQVSPPNSPILNPTNNLSVVKDHNRVAVVASRALAVLSVLFIGGTIATYFAQGGWPLFGTLAAGSLGALVGFAIATSKSTSTRLEDTRKYFIIEQLKNYKQPNTDEFEIQEIFDPAKHLDDENARNELETRLGGKEPLIIVLENYWFLANPGSGDYRELVKQAELEDGRLPFSQKEVSAEHKEIIKNPEKHQVKFISGEELAKKLCAQHPQESTNEEAEAIWAAYPNYLEQLESAHPEIKEISDMKTNKVQRNNRIGLFLWNKYIEKSVAPPEVPAEVASAATTYGVELKA